MEQVRVEVDGVGAGEYRLRETSYEVGRSRGCSIRVNEPDVSRKHVCFERSGEGWLVRPLSEQGVMLNGVLLAMGTEAPVNDGDVLLLGNHTVLRFVANVPEEGDGETAAGIACETQHAAEAGGSPESLANTFFVPQERLNLHPSMPTGELPAGVAAEEPNAEATGLGDYPMDALPEKEDDDGTFGGGEAGGPATMAFDGMHTQAVDEETLAKLREKLTKQSRRRSFPVLGVLGGLAVAGVIAFASYRHFVKPPLEIPYPLDKQGNVIRMEHVFPIFDARIAGKGVYLLLPGVTDGVPDIQGNSLTMTAKMGGDQSVRMKVHCMAEEHARFLGMNRDALFADWITSAGAGDSLVFGTPVMASQFVGKKTEPPGILVDYVTFENTATSGRGIAYMVRTGMKRIILQMEVPDKDYDQIWPALFSPRSFFRVDKTLMDRHWEPSGKEAISPELAQSYIDRCRLELGRQAPSVWHDISVMLTSVLRHASEKDDKDMERLALEMLVTLREEQTKWFRGKRIDRETAVNSKQTRAELRIREECRMIFSSPDDIRFNETREWK